MPIRLTVLYCQRTLVPYESTFPTDPGFDFRILPGTVLRLTRPPYGEPRNILLNPTLPGHLARLRPHALVGYSFSLPSWIAFAYAKLMGKGFVSWSGDTLHTERYLGPAQRLARRLIIPRASACVALSRQAKMKYIAYGAAPGRVKVAVQTAGYGQEHSRSPMVQPKSGGLAPFREALNVLYVGALSERKGVRYLLDSFALVHDRIPESKLVIVGDGPLASELRSRVDRLRLTDEVTFAGYVPHRDLGAYYQRAGLFLFPTQEDTFGVVIAEATASGLPVVTSEFAGAASEYVRDGENGFVIDPVDTDAIAAAVIQVLQNQDLRRRMGDNSRQIAASHELGQAAAQFYEAIGAALRASLEGDERFVEF